MGGPRRARLGGRHSDEPIEYANLAIRGRLVWPIVERAARAGARTEAHAPVVQRRRQRHAAARERASPASSTPSRTCSSAATRRACSSSCCRAPIRRGSFRSAGVFQRRGDLLTAAVSATIADRPDIVRAFNWPDRELSTAGVLVGGSTPHERARPPSRRGARAHRAGHGAADRLVVAAALPGPCGSGARRTTASTSARGCAAGSPARRRATAANPSIRVVDDVRAVDRLTSRIRAALTSHRVDELGELPGLPDGLERAADPTRAGGGGAAVPRQGDRRDRDPHLVEETGIRELSDEVAAADEPDVPVAGRIRGSRPRSPPRRRERNRMSAPATTGSARELSTKAGLPA